jgi:hypothetical protein
MRNDDYDAGLRLLKCGTLVDFQVLKTHVELSPDNKNLFVRVRLSLGTEGEDDSADVAEWGSFGFIFVLAVLSFADARPRGLSEREYVKDDGFNVADLFECLSFVRGELHFTADYIRGRCLKTDIVIEPDGTVTLTTWGRGEVALRWLDKLRGKKLLQLV